MTRPKQAITISPCQSVVTGINTSVNTFRITDIAISHDNRYLLSRVGPKLSTTGVQIIRQYDIHSTVVGKTFKVTLPQKHLIVKLLTTRDPSEVIAITELSETQASEKTHHAFHLELDQQRYQYLAPVQQSKDKDFLLVLLERFLLFKDQQGGLSLVSVDGEEIYPLLNASHGQISALTRVGKETVQITLDQNKHFLLELTSKDSSPSTVAPPTGAPESKTNNK